MLPAVGAGDQGSGDERPRNADPGGVREALRSAVEAVPIERRSGGPTRILAEAKTELDRRVERGKVRDALASGGISPSQTLCFPVPLPPGEGVRGLVPKKLRP